MLREANLPKNFWGFALQAAAYIHNRTPQERLGKTPYEVFTGKIPDASRIRIWGSRAFALQPDVKIKKLDDRGTPCRIIGFDHNCNGNYLVYNEVTKRTYAAATVKIIEQSQQPGQLSELSDSESTAYSDSDHEVQTNEHNDDLNDIAALPPLPPSDDEDNFQTANATPNPTPQKRVYEKKVHPTDNIRRSERLKDNSKQALRAYAAQTATLSTDPATYVEALESKERQHWEIAINAELEALKRNETWEETFLPTNRKAIGCKWVFKLKRDTTGKPTRYKARLCAQGFTQVSGMDYHETFAPVVKATTVKTMFALAAIRDYEIHTLDINNAYLHGILDEEIYMRPPPGYKIGHGNALRLKKGLYGLKQSGRAWNDLLHKELTSLNFHRLVNDECVYVLSIHDHKVYVMVYVDDLVLMNSGGPTITKQVKDLLRSRLDINDLGPIQDYIGIRIIRNRNDRTISFTQPGYTKKILERFDVSPDHKTLIPMNDATHISKDMDSEPLSKDCNFRGLIGSVMYLATWTRPDILYAISALSRFLSNPQQAHYEIGMKLLHYIANTQQYGLTFNGYASNGSTLVAYTDSDWAGDVDTRNSTTGNWFTLAGTTVSAKSKLQPTIATSSMAAEWTAAYQATTETIWLRQLLEELNEKQEGPTTVFSDNNGVIAISKNNESHQRSKHLDVKYRYVRERSIANDIKMVYLSTDKMTADLFTKPLARIKFQLHRDTIVQQVSNEGEC